MANILRGYGVSPSSFRDGPKTFKGYERDSFTDAWLRYPPPSGDSGDAPTDYSCAGSQRGRAGWPKPPQQRRTHHDENDNLRQDSF